MKLFIREGTPIHNVWPISPEVKYERNLLSALRQARSRLCLSHQLLVITITYAYSFRLVFLYIPLCTASRLLYGVLQKSVVSAPSAPFFFLYFISVIYWPRCGWHILAEAWWYCRTANVFLAIFMGRPWAAPRHWPSAHVFESRGMGLLEPGWGAGDEHGDSLALTLWKRYTSSRRCNALQGDKTEVSGAARNFSNPRHAIKNVNWHHRFSYSLSTNFNVS